MANHYSRLGLEYKATHNEIRDAYRALAKKYHPDVSELPDAEERFIEITEAYEILSDPEKRRRYDLTRYSPSPNMARQRKQRTYEDYVKRSQAQARKKAKKYSKQRYEKFDHAYFDTEAQYYIPKFMGCFGMGIVALIIAFAGGAIASQFDGGILFFFLLMMGVITGLAYFSTKFDMWHNERQKQRKRDERSSKS